MAVHVVAHPLPNTQLWRDATEALALWRSFVRAFPDLVAFCVLHDHVHLLLPHPPGLRVARAMSGYARWRAHHRGRCEPVWQRQPDPSPIADQKHFRRTIRYIELNAVRAGLADDPLGWPLATHRDRCGFAFPPVLARERNPERFHRWVSADESVHTEGTALPTPTPGPVTWADVQLAVGSIFRVLPSAFHRRGPARTAAVRTAWIFGVRDLAVLRRETGLGNDAIWKAVAGLPTRGAPIADPVISACVRAVGDERFAGLWMLDPRSRASRRP
jgi:REP element-mobilizing transposase RayT